MTTSNKECHYCELPATHVATVWEESEDDCCPNEIVVCDEHALPLIKIRDSWGGFRPDDMEDGFATIFEVESVEKIKESV